MSAARSSTATATTVTADAPRAYRGRFAPSPSGALHLGSLVAALGSYLDARRHGGTWLIRIEDLDTPRVVPGAEEALVDTLARLGLKSDEQPLLHQSTRGEAYAAAFERLSAAGRVYPCSCTRRDTAQGPYPGTCRDAGPRTAGPWAWRFRMPSTDPLCFEDRFQGQQCFALSALGDPVIRRRDGLFAYQLAVVVDDAAQQITDVVRGADLLDATAWQIALGDALQVPRLRYAHLPLVRDADGQKLSKSASAAAIAAMPPAEALLAALRALGQSPPAHLKDAGTATILEWALANFQNS